MCPRKVAHQQIIRAPVCFPYNTFYQGDVDIQAVTHRKIKHIDFIFNDVTANWDECENSGEEQKWKPTCLSAFNFSVPPSRGDM